MFFFTSNVSLNYYGSLEFFLDNLLGTRALQTKNAYRTTHTAFAGYKRCTNDPQFLLNRAHSRSLALRTHCHHYESFAQGRPSQIVYARRGSSPFVIRSRAHIYLSLFVFIASAAARDIETRACVGVTLARARPALVRRAG